MKIDRSTPEFKLRFRIGMHTDYLEKTVGDGTPFFDAMDEWLGQPEFFQYQLDRATKYSSYINLVVTGKWGRKFAEWYGGGVLVMPGDLRHGRQILSPVPNAHKGEQYTMLDNSCYKGRTRDKVADWMSRAGATLLTNLVLYDGSREPIPGTTGVFRYHE